MAYTKYQISEIAENFWAKAISSGKKITDIFEAAECVLPVQFVFIHNLTLGKAKEWLKEKGNPDIAVYSNISDRVTHGFIITRKRLGLIFINASDSESEQRFTAAHEVGHFILDHQLPRKKAIRGLGEEIVEVLNGERLLNSAELALAIVRGIDIRRNNATIEKEGDGSFRSWANFTAENDADRLALELLAPKVEVIRHTLPKQTILPHTEFVRQCQEVLELYYFLPPQIALQYSVSLAYSVTNGPTLAEKLGLQRNKG